MKNLILIIMLTAFSCKGEDITEVTTRGDGPTVEELADYSVMYLGDACFWCTETMFECVYGVVEAESGYGGGDLVSPTYRNHGTHAEVIKVYYDESKVSYTTLIDAFFDQHSLGQSPDRGNSYRAILFYDGAQQRAAIDSRYEEKIVELNGFQFFQEVRPVSEVNFTKAEDYHQNIVARYEAGERVTNPGYIMNESIPRRDHFKRTTSVRLKN